MKIRGFTVIMLLGVLLVGSVACWGPVFSKPSVGYVPQGWYLSEDSPYGTYYEEDGTESGLIGYTDIEDGDFVLIYYGDVASSLKGRETAPSALIAKAIEYSIFSPEETGTMTVAGEIAGYTKMYDADWDWYEMSIVFVKGSTCIFIYTIYDATSTDEAQAMSIINSISF